jgi:hypothetical protein
VTFEEETLEIVGVETSMKVPPGSSGGTTDAVD